MQAKGIAPGATAPPRLASDAAVSKSTAPAPTGILVVEDQEDIRRMVATALEIEGYDVFEAANAQEGLRCLERRRFHLVLTDYAMPGGTGTWMLQEAARRGLMHGTPAMIVTAHPDVRELSNIAVINKPLDLDNFLEQVRSILGSAAAPAMVAPAGRTATRLELVLYVSSESDASKQARENLERVLARYNSAQVHCTIVDLLREPFAGEADRIAFTPTLVKQYPRPRTWVVGNLRHGQILEDLLESSGVSAAE